MNKIIGTDLVCSDGLGHIFIDRCKYDKNIILEIAQRGTFGKCVGEGRNRYVRIDFVYLLGDVVEECVIDGGKISRVIGIDNRSAACCNAAFCFRYRYRFIGRVVKRPVAGGCTDVAILNADTDVVDIGGFEELFDAFSNCIGSLFAPEIDLLCRCYREIAAFISVPVFGLVGVITRTVDYPVLENMTEVDGFQTDGSLP